jgi:hypothetical protein
LRVEEERCKPPVVGLLMLALGGGRVEEALLIPFPVALGGREDMVGAEGLIGSRLGDWLDLSAGRALEIVEFARTDLSLLPVISPAGLRRERVREGIADIVLFTRRDVCINNKRLGTRPLDEIQDSHS